MAHGPAPLPPDVVELKTAIKRPLSQALAHYRRAASPYLEKVASSA
jgi:hypothetical protein